MGTDIHARLQHRETYTNRDFLTGKEASETYWATINPPRWWPRAQFYADQITFYEAQYTETRQVEDLQMLIYYRAEWIAGRNYNLFAILADVRNGYGFAGVETGTPWPTIAAGRGIPDGVDIEDKEFPWLGDHSHTWVTVAELLAFDWHGTAQRHTGIVPLAEYRPGVRPTNWCGDIFGRNVLVVEESQVDGLEVVEGTEVHVRQYWDWSAADACGDFVTVTLPSLEQLCVELGNSPDAVRLVIGFDS